MPEISQIRSQGQLIDYQDRWVSTLCASTPGCVLDPDDNRLFLAEVTGLISAYRALCGRFDQKAISLVLAALSRRLLESIDRCVAMEEVDCICPRSWRLERARGLAHILIDIAWASGPTTYQAQVPIRSLLSAAYLATDLQEQLSVQSGGVRDFAPDGQSPAALADRLAMDLFETVEQLEIAMSEQGAYSLY
jgi:hypothetical protein